MCFGMRLLIIVELLMYTTRIHIAACAIGASSNTGGCFEGTIVKQIV